MHSLEVIRRLVKNAWTPVDIKALYESDKLQALLNVFSQSKVLWVFRHYDNVVNSQDMRWKGKADAYVVGLHPY
jgi:hypothetical protein